MTNSQMIPNRFAKMHEARSLYRFMQQAWSQGMTVYMANSMKATYFAPKHADRVKLGKFSVYVQRGKNWDAIIPVSTKIWAESQ